MNYLKRMEKSNANNQLLYNLCRIILIQKLSLLDEIEEIFSLHELSDNIDMSFCLYALLEFKE